MIITIVAILLALLAGSVYGIVKAHEEAKAERRKFQRIVSASESKPWSPPPRGPKGFNRNRRKAA
jgi:hypothetical protein